MSVSHNTFLRQRKGREPDLTLTFRGDWQILPCEKRTAAEGTLTGPADRSVIDVSTDGRWNVGSNPGAVIDDLVFRRILRVVDDEDGDTIFCRLNLEP